MQTKFSRIKVFIVHLIIKTSVFNKIPVVFNYHNSYKQYNKSSGCC